MCGSLWVTSRRLENRMAAIIHDSSFEGCGYFPKPLFQLHMMSCHMQSKIGPILNTERCVGARTADCFAKGRNSRSMGAAVWRLLTVWRFSVLQWHNKRKRPWLPAQKERGQSMVSVLRAQLPDPTFDCFSLRFPWISSCLVSFPCNLKWNLAPLWVACRLMSIRVSGPQGSVPVLGPLLSNSCACTQWGQ